MGETREKVVAVGRKVEAFAKAVNVAGKSEEIARLESRMSEPAFWNDQKAAQAVMAQLKALKGVVDPFRELEAATREAGELAELAEIENDQATMAEVQAEAARLMQRYDGLELKLALSGRHDASDVFMSIKPGAGGTEACDWASMLFRMYSAYCAKAGYAVEVIDMLPGDEAGLKSCTLRVSGPNAYGYFKSEMGTHRLVRMSPFNADGKRQTSFAAVEVTPELDELSGAEEPPDRELRVDTYRAGGAGGQHVNKTDSAVRLTHLPTGIVAACQSERSQVQNRLQAMKVLVAKIQQLKEAERLEELKDLKGDRGTIGWGHQIRSYFLQPSQLVKDLRTGHETNQAHNVLDGDLQPFIDAYLRWQLAGRPDRRTLTRDEE